MPGSARKARLEARETLVPTWIHCWREAVVRLMVPRLHCSIWARDSHDLALDTNYCRGTHARRRWFHRDRADAARRPALRPEGRRPDLDHGAHLREPRLHDLRHAVCAR